MKQITTAIRILLVCGIFSTAIAQTAPTFTDCPVAPITQINDAGLCGANVAFATPTPNDPDGTATFTVTQIEGPASGDFFPVGDTTVTFEATGDPDGVATCTFTVTVTDNEAPVANCIAPFTITLDEDGLASITTADVDDTVTPSSDNCPDAVLSLDITSFDCSNIGDNTVTLTITDAAGNTDTCTTTVTVEAGALDITCPADIILNLSENVATVTPVSASTSFTTVFGSSLNNTYNGSGLSEFPSFTATHDATVPANSFIGGGTSGIIEYSLGGTERINGIYIWNQNAGGPGASGSSGIQDVIISASTNGTDFTPIAGAPATFAQVIASDNAAVQEFTFEPIEASTIRIEVLSNYGDGNTGLGEIIFSSITDGCGAVITYDAPIVATNCVAATVTQTTGFASGNPFPIGTTTNTFIVDDGNGNTATCSFDITIIDDVAPIAICQDITVQLDATGSVTITPEEINNSSTDNCGTATPTLDITDFTCADIGENTVILTITDDNGNSATCEAIVTVENTVVPTVVCQDITISLDDTGVATIVAADIDNGSTVACGAPILSADITEFNCENLGVNTVTLTVTDDQGNTAICEAIVTVESNSITTITCPADITLNLSEVATPIIPSSASTSFTTAFGSSLTNTFNGNGLTTFPDLNSDHSSSGVTNSWIGEGTSGTITFNLGGSQTVSGFSFWNQNNGGPGASGTSGIQNVIISSSTNGTDFTPIPGAPAVFAQVTGDGPVAPEVFNFTPIIASSIRIEVQSNYGDGNTAFAEIAFSDDTPGCGALVAYVTPFSNAACNGGGEVTQTAGLPSGSAFPVGTTTNTFEVTDGSGGTQTCSFDIVITDNVAPDVLCQNIEVLLDGTGNAIITAADIDNGTTDNCGDVTLSIDQDTFTCADVGTPVTVTLTATDVNGNSASCEAIVTVTSNELPVAVCQDITIQLVDGIASITPAEIDNGSGSTCGTAVELSLDVQEFTCENLGDNTVTLTVTDASGNTDTCTAIVTVENNEPLVITCPADININLSEVATPIIPNSASTSFTTAFGSSLNNTFNGTGLDAFPSLESEHAPSSNTNSWIGEGTTGTIDFSLGAVTTVSGLAFWNQNGGGPGADGTSGIQNVIISSSTNGTDFTPIPGAPTSFTQVIPNTAAAPEIFNWTPVMASTIRIEVQSNYGDGNTAFAEIAFSDTTSGCGAVITYEDPFTNQECFPGSTLTQTAGFASGSAFPLGTTTNTFEVDDGAGNIITCSFDVTITDDVAPDVVCQDIEVVLDETGNFVITAADIDNGTTDNCGDVTLSIDQDTFTCADVGTPVTVTLTATDVNGNSSSCEAIVTVTSNELPVAVCQDITIQLVDGMASITPADIDNGSGSTCGTAVELSLDVQEFTCENLGDNTVTLTVTDASGNTDTCTAIVTVENNEPLVITCPADININLSEVATPIIPNSASTSFTTAFGTSLNNTFDGTGLDAFPSLESEHAPSSNTNSWIGEGTTGTIDFSLGAVTTVSGLAFWNQNGGGPGADGTSGVQNVIISSSTNGTDFTPIPGAPTSFTQVIPNAAAAPEIFNWTPVMASTIRIEVQSNYGDGNTAFAEIAFSDTTSGCGAVITYEGPFTNQECFPGSTLTQTAGFASGSAFPLGTTTNTFEVDDGAGNIITCSFDVTITDDVAPDVVCQDITIQLDETGSASILASDIDGGTADNCTDVTLSIDIDKFGCVNVGENIVTLTATDGNGNTSFCEAIVTVENLNIPEAICQNITVELDATGIAILDPVLLDGGSTFVCGPLTYEADVTEFTCENLGENSVVLTVTDPQGNTSTCEAIVTVVNNEPVTITCPDDIILNLSEALEPIVITSTTTTFTAAFGSELSNATNGAGLTVSPSTTATHEPTTPSNSFIGTGTTGTLEFNFGSETLVSGLSFWNQNGGGPGANGSSGVQNVVFSYSTDGTNFIPIPGAPSIFSQITDNDFSAPEIFTFDQIAATVIRMEVTSNYGDSNTAFAEIVFADISSGCGAIVTYEGPFTNALCTGGGELVQTGGFASGSPFPLGTTTNTFEVTDGAGNVQTCSFDITIIDDVAPRAVCQNITLEVDETGSIAITPEDIDGGSTDNCGDITLSIDTDTFTCDNVGENIVTLTVTDSNGLSSSCEAIVTIVGSVAPTAVCQDITLLLDADGTATLTPDQIDGGSFATCGLFTLSTDITTFTCDNLGENTVILTATDASGNSTTCEAIVTVENNEPLDLTCPEDMIINLSEVLEPVTPTNVTTSFNSAFGSSIQNTINGLGLATSPSLTATHDGTTTNNAFIGAGTTGTIDFDLGTERTITGFSFWNLNGGGPGANGSSGIQDVSISYSVDGTTFVPVDGAPAVFAQALSSQDVAPETFSFTQIAATVIRFEVLSNYGDGNTGFAEIAFADTTVGCGAAIVYEGPFTNVDCLGGGELVQTAGFASGSIFPLGTTTNTFEVTDTNGTTLSCSFDITVIDDVAPRAVCQDITIQLDETGSATIEAADVDGGSTDNCGDVSIAIDIDKFGCENVGENIVTLTVTDSNGLISTCEAIVTIENPNIPVAVCQNITLELDATGVGILDPALLDGGSTFVCGPLTYEADITEFTCENLGENTVVLTVTDPQGNTSTCEAIVTVVNNEPVTITCPEDLILNLSEVLEPVTISSTTTSFSPAFGSDIANATNGTGLSTTTSTTANHEATTPSNSFIGAGTSGTIDFNLGGETLISGFSFWNQNGGGPGANGTSGIQEVTMLYSTDGTTFTAIPGAPTTFAQVTTSESSAPELFTFDQIAATVIRMEVMSNYGDGNTAFAEIVFADTPSGCGAIVTYEGPLTNALCAGGGELVQTEGFTSGSPFPLGTTTNTFEVTDGAGNVQTCSFDITIIDDVAPRAVCQAITIEIGEDGTASITPEDIDGGSTDNCGDITLSIDTDTFTCDNVGENTVTLTVTDSNGLIATCEAIVTVISDSPPTAVCMDLTVQLDEDGMAIITPEQVDGGSFSNCGTFELTLDQDTFTCEQLGENIVILTATSPSGELTTCEAIVTVENTQMLNIECPEDIVLNLSEVLMPVEVSNGTTSFSPAFGSELANAFNGTGLEMSPSLMANHEASTPSNAFIGTGSSGSIDFDLGQETIINGFSIWNLNGGGPGAEGSSGIQDVTILYSLDNVTYTVLPEAPTVFAQVTTSEPVGPEVFTFTQVAARYIRFDVQSNYGDGNTGIAEVAFADVTDGCGAIVNYDGPFENLDCLGGGTLEQTAGFESGSPFPLGTTTNTFIATDTNGNEVTCSFTITLIDDVAPRAVCAPITVMLDENGIATITADDIDNGSSDNCGDITTAIDIDSFTCEQLGENTVVLTVTDANGNSSTCETIVTVETNIAPTAVCQNIIVELDEEGMITVDPVLVDGGSTAVCGELTYELDVFEFTCDNLGENTVILTVTDEQGLTATCEAVITVVNNQPIEITCPEDLVINLSEISNPIVPTGATTTYNSAFGSTLSNAIDGTGLNTSPSLTSDHAPSTPENSWIGEGSTGTIDFDLGSETTVSGFSFWNQNGGGPGPDGTSGIRDVLISYSIDGSTYIDVEGAPTVFAQAEENAPSAPEVFTFTPITATTIRMEVLSNYGDGNTGFAEIVFSDAASGCGAIISYEGPFTNENCVGGGTVTQTAGFASGNPFPVGTTTNTFTVEDGNGNLDTCSFTITIIDDLAPRMFCQNIEIALDENGMATITPEDIDGGTSDNCTPVTLSIDIDSFTCENLGENVVTLTATDENGNIASCEAIVTVTSSVIPQITCQDITVELDENGMVTIIPEDVLADTSSTCLIDNLELDISEFGCANTGPNVVIVTATDNAGNTATCEAIVTVIDVTAPTPECMDATISLDENGIAILTPEDVIGNLVPVQGIPFTGDGVPESIPMTGTGGTNCAGGPTTSTAAVDLEGTIGDAYRIATVIVDLDHSFVGDLDLTLTSPQGTELVLSAGNGGNAQGYENATFDDDGEDITMATGLVNGIYSPEGGTFADTFAGEQINGNWSLSVCDNTQGDVGQLLRFEISFADPDDDLLGVPDNCTPTSDIEFDVDTFDCSNLGENVVNITVTDAKGNVATCTVNVTVVDEAPPTAICQSIVVILDEDTGTASITPDMIDNGSTDNCGGEVTLSLDITEFGCADVGENIVTLTVTDQNGNTATCEATVLVDADDFGLISCQEDFTVEADLFDLYEIENYIESLTDNCGGGTFTNVSQQPVAGTIIDAPQEVPVTLTGFDEDGNMVTCEFTITVTNNPLSVDDLSLRESDIILFPNPTRGDITLKNLSNTPLDYMVITDIRGRIVERIELSSSGINTNISLRYYEAGVYFMHITAGQTQLVKRVVKK
ncbi:HYR domain-containing protein [uncultured Dokdonia sp.]|uniref:HYR domain-containing protein n=1 Tax=uncultured Dokdonia sp. TaxID=575653 RepID=UPI0026176B85|nr:HYR domain-containing protein [uncultured Dokdonia sp.]